MNTDLAARQNIADPLLPPTGPPSRAAAAGTSSAADAALQARLASLKTNRAGGAPSAGKAKGAAPTAPRSGSRRRHAAKHSRTAALTFSALSTVGLGYLLSATDAGASAAPEAAAGIVTPQAIASTSPTAQTPAPAATTSPTAQTPAPAATTSPAPAAAAAPVTTAAAPVQVNGEAFSNRFGPVQVQATFAPDGSITSVDAVQTPYRDGQSVGINNYAVPRLNSEALTAQSANVNTISGATYTSNGYRQSLQSAIDIAVANGITTVATGA